MQTSGITAEAGREQFMALLVAQMRNQNPLEPIDNEEFVSQLAQFSSLEGMEKLNASFSDMLALQQITQGADLIGRTVVYQESDVLAPRQGTVEGVALQEGKLQLMVQGAAVSLDSVLGLAAGI